MIVIIIKVIAVIALIISVVGMLYLAKNWFGLIENILPEKRKWLYIFPYIMLFSGSLSENGKQYRNGVIKGAGIFLLGMAVFLMLLTLSKKLTV